MATWNPDAETSHPLDYRLVRNSFVTMFWRPSVLAESVQWLRAHDYDVVEVDAGSWASERAMLDVLASSLDFPDCFGRNLDALNDCMSDVASGDYGWRNEATGLVIVLYRFDAFSRADGVAAHALLSIIARSARSAMLIGNRFLCLAQSDDARLSLQPVGETPVEWNDHEWLDVKRGL